MTSTLISGYFDSINRADQIVKRSIEIGLSGVCFTNHECLSGSIKYLKLQKKIKEEHPDFKIGIGNEIYLINERGNNQPYYHFILIAKDLEGHRQLRELSSRAWMQSYYDRGMERVPTTKEELQEVVKKNPGHLIATTACIGGELGSSILEMEKARKVEDNSGAAVAYNRITEFIDFCTGLFGDDFYIECAPGCSKEQVLVNEKLVQIAKLYNIKMVIGTDAHYLKKEDRYVHKAYLNSKGGDREVDSFYEYAYLQDESDIFNNLQGEARKAAAAMFQNSMEIYDKIETYDLMHPQTIPSVPVKDYPITIEPSVEHEYPMLKKMYNSDDIYERYWVNECVNKLKNIGKCNEEYLSRLEEEADIKRTIGEKLHTNMFCYPITLQYYIDMIWDSGSLVGAGRGSSCSGLNHYLLGITQLDPIEWNLPFWRYLNRDRVELGDIDIDLCPSKKGSIVRKIKKERGSRFKEGIDDLSRNNLGCVLVATFGTEGTRSTILTACRGYRSEEYPDGIDVDTAQFLSSLIPSERGFLWSLDDVLYGNKEKGREPSFLFINEVNQYPGLLNIMKGIENLINKRSSHASGVIFLDEDPYEFGCFMRTPKGEIITQYDLHDCESAGMTKYDFLVTEVQDKIVQTVTFLQEAGEIEKDLSLREIYNKYLHPNVLPLDDEKVWKAIQSGSVLNVFQFDSAVGSQAAKKIKPKNIIELTDANGLMRLMTSEQGEETPMEKYIRFKNNIDLWYREMSNNGLTKKEQAILEPYFKSSYGVPPSQEQLMMMLMDENICNFSLKDANAARKVVGKKQMDKIPALRQQIYDTAKSKALGQYVWKYGVGPQMGYSFSVIHSLAYSFIGFQTAYLATRWNPIYWDTACLIVNSGSLEDSNEEFLEDDDGDIIGVQKKENATDYTKVAKAIGDIIESGIKVSLIDINKSDYGFRPDVENNQILFGLKALNGVGAPIIEEIIKNRPYCSLKDFMKRCNLNKTAMVSLIKSGAFDNLWDNNDKINPRIKSMIYYLQKASDPKSKLTLQNMNGLIQAGLIPDKLSFEKKTYQLNKMLKAMKRGKYYFFTSSKALEFYETNFDNDLLEVIGGVTCINQKTWDNIYSDVMNKVRDWLKENQEETLQKYNDILFFQTWEKYAKGNISSWEMDSLCFYYHDHELKNVNQQKYGIVDFNKLNSVPAIASTFKRNGKQIPIYQINKIAGTVIGKNDTSHSVSLLTTTGVVTIKFNKDHYALFGRQISEVQADGTKKVMEKGWFIKGTMLLVSGYRRDDTFVVKKYKNTGGHQLYKITNVNGENLELTHLRYGQQEEE